MNCTSCGHQVPLDLSNLEERLRQEVEIVYLKDQHRWTYKELAAKFGKSTFWVQDRYRTGKGAPRKSFRLKELS